MRIGFIGVGSMGTRIVDLMIGAGHDLTLWARRPESLAPFAGRAAAAETPADVGRASDVVGICVWEERDVDEVLLGERGVFAGMRPGGSVLIHSTISPAACARLQREASERGLGLLDAPVSVGSNVPKLLVMVGGDAEVFGRCAAALEAFGDPVLHLGPVGSGQVAKLMNNTLLAATVGLAADAIALGGELGLSEQQLAAALAAGSSRGTWCALMASRPASGAPVGPGRTHEWAYKDVGLATSLAAQAGLDTSRAVLALGGRGVEVLG